MRVTQIWKNWGKKKLKRYGYVARMEDKRWPKPVMTWPPEGRRRQGRLEVMWEKEVKKNLITVQQDAISSVYYVYVGSSTCFGC